MPKDDPIRDTPKGGSPGPKVGRKDEPRKPGESTGSDTAQENDLDRLPTYPPHRPGEPGHGTGDRNVL
jgi:hypothetical protein